MFTIYAVRHLHLQVWKCIFMHICELWYLINSGLSWVYNDIYVFRLRHHHASLECRKAPSLWAGSLFYVLFGHFSSCIGILVGLRLAARCIAFSIRMHPDGILIAEWRYAERKTTDVQTILIGRFVIFQSLLYRISHWCCINIRHPANLLSLWFFFTLSSLFFTLLCFQAYTDILFCCRCGVFRVCCVVFRHILWYRFFGRCLSYD